MRSKKTGLHPFLILLAVALVSVLFVVSCGDDDEPAVSEGTGAAEAASASAAASQAAKAAEAAALAAEAAVAQAAQLAAAAQAAGTAASAEESEAVEAAQAAAVQAAADAQAAAAQAAELAAAAQAAAAAEAAAIEAAAAAAAQAAAAAAQAAAAAAGPKYGGSLRIGVLAGSSGDLAPGGVSAEIDLFIEQAVYDNLLMIQPDLSIKPELATSWEGNDDFSSWTFQLRKGVKFHHGKDFNAEDVVFTFNRLLDPVLDFSIRGQLGFIEDIVAIDDYTVRFDLDSSVSSFPSYLSAYQARILPVDVDPARLVFEEFGTGPFILEEHLPIERSVLVRNPDYWEEGKPYLDEIVILAIPEAAARESALKNGDVDLIYQLAPQSAAGIEDHPETTVLLAASGSYINLVIDNTAPPFDNKLVRQAMQAATDRNLINQAVLHGLGIPANEHPIHPDDPLFAPQHAPPDYNPELAKQLLAEAGYSDGIDIVLHTGDVGPGMVEFAVAYKESAAPAGIRVEIKEQPADGFWGQVWMVEPFTVGWWFGTATPDAALAVQYLGTSSWNAMRWNNPEFDELLIKARAQDLEGQKESYARIQEIIIDEVPQLAVAFQPLLYGVRNDVKGVAVHPLGFTLVQDGWLDR